MDISVIIPVFRGGNILKELTGRVVKAINDYSYEILFICDKCDDLSLNIVKELKENDPVHIKVYRFKDNYGQHKALQFGFGKASGDLIVTLDEDLQHDPADIIKLIEKQKGNDYDIVYGRFTNLQQNGSRIILSNVLRKILKHFIPAIYEDYSPFRLIKRDIVTSASKMVSPYTFIDDFLSRITQNISFAEITHHKRSEGRSSYNLRKLIKHGLFIILAYSRLITWFLITAGLLLTLGIILYVLSLISADASGVITGKSLIVIFGTGLFLVIVSIIGSLINHSNTIANNYPIRLISDDTI